jgi:adenylate cyclase
LIEAGAVFQIRSTRFLAGSPAPDPRGDPDGCVRFQFNPHDGRDGIMAKHPTALARVVGKLRAQRSVLPASAAAAFRAEELAGLALAARVRAGALAAAAVWVFMLERPPALYWYEGVVATLALLGAAHLWVARRPGRIWMEYILVALDATVVVSALVVLTVQLHPAWPPQAALRTAPVAYLFLLTAYVAVSYSPRLMVWSGVVGAVAWAIGVIWVATRPGTRLSLDGSTDSTSMLQLLLDPHYVDVAMRVEEIAILLVSAAALAFVVRRSRQLVIRRSDIARERANLARYFSPRLVDELAGRDEPLGPVRRQQVGVLFADIVGFTTMAETMPAEQVMLLLREYHGRMERQVFRHDGTLEKFIGDALLATFGVPDPGPHDASDALACARAMLDELERWNEERSSRGEQPIRIGIGLHYGPAVLGDIGSDRNMAFAVIGDTVNTASRLQALTRHLGGRAVVSESLLAALEREQGDSVTARMPLIDAGEQRLRGREEPVRVWLLDSTPAVAPS